MNFDGPRAGKTQFQPTVKYEMQKCPECGAKSKVQIKKQNAKRTHTHTLMVTKGDGVQVVTKTQVREMTNQSGRKTGRRQET